MLFFYAVHRNTVKEDSRPFPFNLMKKNKWKNVNFNPKLVIFHVFFLMIFSRSQKILPYVCVEKIKDFCKKKMKNNKEAYCIQLLPLYVYKLYHSALIVFERFLSITMHYYSYRSSLTNLLSCLPRLHLKASYRQKIKYCLCYLLRYFVLVIKCSITCILSGKDNPRMHCEKQDGLKPERNVYYKFLFRSIFQNISLKLKMYCLANIYVFFMLI